MTTADGEPVAGPSHGNSHVMQMTSQLHLCLSQQLQQTTVCLPVSVQQLTYEDDEFHDDIDDDDTDRSDGDDDDDVGPETMSSEVTV